MKVMLVVKKKKKNNHYGIRDCGCKYEHPKPCTKAAKHGIDERTGYEDYYHTIFSVSLFK